MHFFSVAGGHRAKAKDLAERALRGLAGFARALKVKCQDIEVGFDFDPEPGLAHNGDLEHDLQALLEVVGSAAQRAETALLMFIDELQYVPEAELAALITALHGVAQRSLPIMLVGAGLPQLPGRMGSAKSDAERLFDFPEIGPLPRDATLQAVEKGSPITADDVEVACTTALAALDASFFRVRFDRLAPTRAQLIGKGMVWSPNHGDTAFTVPLFDGFMRRVMPGEDWKA